ncbi:MAG: 3-ketoacyl-ACP reductase [candidate division KSB1 bacterium]|nr:3-ketoacyl-ACP reductase [candidate division KSB1 bacterium]
MKIALVTGGSRGIGYGISLELARAGFNLALCGRRPENEISGMLQELRETGREVLYCPCDISSASDRKRLLKTVVKKFARIHVLVNNAGVAPRSRKDILNVYEKDFEWLLKINLQGPFFLTQSVANQMIDCKTRDSEFSGCIINITSISASVASVNRGEYCISKAGLAMMTKLFAARLGDYDIPVYEIQPGIIKTDMTAAVSEKYDKLLSEGLTVQKRWGYPVDVARAVVSLAKCDFPYSTGSVFKIDGGLTIQRL